MLPGHDQHQDLRQPSDRLGNFLDAAIGDLKQGLNTMPELPANEIAAPIRKSITGASFLGEQFKARIAAAKATVEGAKTSIVSALSEIETAAAHASDVAKAIQAEADDLKAALGQVSNGAPE